MKTIITLILALVAFLPSVAQEDMPEVWSTKLDHKIDHYGCDNLGTIGYGYAASDKEISVYENETGKVLWTKKFKDVGPRLRKVDDIIAIWDAKKIFLLDLKMGKEQIAVIDMLTGELLWDSDKYKLKQRDMLSYISEEDGFIFSFKKMNVFVKAATGEELWSTSKFIGTVGKYYYKDGFLTTINFVPSGLMAAFTGFKNQIAKLDMKTGEVIWENTYIGRADRKIVTREFMYGIDLIDGHVVLYLNGMQVYDYETGAQLWSAAFDYEVPVKAPGNAVKFGVYGALADPLITEDHVYVVDMSGKKDQYVNKYDRKTGKLVWKSQEIHGGAKVVPAIYVVDDRVILQIGGTVEVQGTFKVKDADGNIDIVRKVYDSNVKPYGVQAFNAEDGRLVWDSERFKKGITNMYVHNEDIIVCSGKALYSLQLENGDVKYEIDAKNGGVGNAVMILDNNDKTVVVGEKGVSTFHVENGNFIAANKYKRASVMAYRDNILVLETDKADVAAFDVNDKCKYWSYNAKKNSSSVLTTDGDHLYVYEKNTVTRLKTRP
jgi:stringent starvation protein B